MRTEDKTKQGEVQRKTEPSDDAEDAATTEGGDKQAEFFHLREQKNLKKKDLLWGRSRSKNKRSENYNPTGSFTVNLLLMSNPKEDQHDNGCEANKLTSGSGHTSSSSSIDDEESELHLFLSRSRSDEKVLSSCPSLATSERSI